MPSSRFRTMYRDLGLNRAGVAQLLRVSERTIHNWETGHHQVPYSAYKLVRLMTHQEFPDPAWAGWHLTAGVLYSPEGHGFKPKDSNWWSLLCRKAAMFNELYAKIYKKAETKSLPDHESMAKPNAEVLVTLHNIPSSWNKQADAPKSAELVRKLVTPHKMFIGEHSHADITGFPCPADKRYSRLRLVHSVPKGGTK